MQISQAMTSYTQPNFDQEWWKKMSRPVCIRIIWFFAVRFHQMRDTIGAYPSDDVIHSTKFWSRMMTKDVSASLYQNYLILCSKILLNARYNWSLSVLFPLQHTGFQACPFLKAFLVTTIHFNVCYWCFICIIQQAYEYVRSRSWRIVLSSLSLSFFFVLFLFLFLFFVFVFVFLFLFLFFFSEGKPKQYCKQLTKLGRNKVYHVGLAPPFLLWVLNT